MKEEKASKFPKEPALSLPKGAYNPQENEKEILDFWMENKFYSPEFLSEKPLSTSRIENRETFSIILPPPNANGNLHLGHMSGYAYQDLMGRYNRMQGKKVLLLPGKDHAGIQTEVVFEKVLEERGLNKKEMGREKFYRKSYEFCMKNSENARSQEQKIGLSADFDRELFTLDPKVVDNILNAFIMMYEDKLVYRGKRLINWCPRCQSALADIDTEFKDSQTPFVYFKYAFITPEDKALELKKTYEGKTIEFRETSPTKAYVKRESMTEDEKSMDLKKHHDKHSLNAEFKTIDNEIAILPIGYNFDDLTQDSVSGKVIGIQMRLDKNFKLVVVNTNFDGNIEEEINRIFLDQITRYAGAHIILFVEYPEDKFYTNGFLLGTVRPETKFGDTAIAVDPKDERYKDFVGKSFKVQTLMGEADINIIADHAVDKDFGTGAVKVTPAHAPEDWDIAIRHPEKTMPEKQVIGFDGKMNHLTGKYEGMTVKEAREAMREDMKEIGILIYVDENYENRIRICERCKHQIEPLISYQWFVDTKPLKDKAKKLVEDGHTDILPEGKKKTYLEWMNSPEDWCITRQLWWGYRIPVWYKGKPEEYVAPNGEVKEKIGDKILEKLEDYAEIMHVGQHNPDSKNLDLILVPGKHAYADRELFPMLKEIYPKTQIVKLDDPDEALYSDYEDKFKDIEFSEDSTVVTHSLGARAILKYSIENNIKFKNLIMTAPAARLLPKYYEAYRNMWGEEIEKEYPKVNSLIENITIIYSDDDELMTVEDFKNFTAKFENPRVIKETGMMHYYGKDYNNHSMVLQNILKSIVNESSEWFQDEDVLDTWFSSGQWPYATLKAREGDFGEFYKTQVMETGWDILLFWVTRMMLLNPYRAEKEGVGKDSEQVPFENVYLHGLVLDKNGVKMSKSKGNGIDPFEMMQKYGTDALRFSFVVGNSPGQNYRLYEEKIASYRNFCNKIWNASKFSFMNIEDVSDKLVNLQKNDLSMTEEDEAFLDHLNEVIEETQRRMDSFLFGIAAQELYESFWHTFADEYIEKVKQRLYTKDRDGNPINQSEEEQASRLTAQWTIYKALDTYLKLLHPFIPFITERIWQELPKSQEESETIMYSKYPEVI